MITFLLSLLLAVIAIGGILAIMRAIYHLNSEVENQIEE